MSLFFSALVLFRHRGNMHRLINGNEPKIKRKFI
jgi:glycerol-3-phosphate acyltransferase PlsY